MRVMEGVSEGEADLEPFDVREVSRDATEERRGDAHAGEIEGAHGGAPARDGREDLLGRGAASDEAEGLHRSAGEDGRGRGRVAAEGAQERHVRWR